MQQLIAIDLVIIIIIDVGQVFRISIVRQVLAHRSRRLSVLVNIVLTHRIDRRILVVFVVRIIIIVISRRDQRHLFFFVILIIIVELVQLIVLLIRVFVFVCSRIQLDRFIKAHLFAPSRCLTSLHLF